MKEALWIVNICIVVFKSLELTFAVTLSTIWVPYFIPTLDTIFYNDTEFLVIAKPSVLS